MRLTFIPNPDSPVRVIAADDPQPFESWSAHASDIRIASFLDSDTDPSQSPAPLTSELTADLSASPLPDFLGPLPPLTCPHCPDRRQFLAARQQAGYYHALWSAAKRREAKLQARLDEKDAEIRSLKQRLFGSKSESHHAPDRRSPPADPLADDASPSTDAAAFSANSQPKLRRPRGQQKENSHPKRRDYSHLPVVTEKKSLSPEEARCSCCGEPLAPDGFKDDSHVIEIEVKAYRRRIRRRRYRRICSCEKQPLIVAAPVLPRVVPNSRFGVSVWTQILLDKYQFCRPTNKCLADLRSHGLDLSIGTVTDGLKRVAPLFEPLYEKLIERNRKQALWGADETRWPVFQVVKGKANHRWYIWLFESKDCAVFTLDKGRAHNVPEDHFGETARGIVMVDRYSAYKAMKHVKEGRLRLAFCWAHQRRDFLDAEKSWPKLSEWAAEWVRRIGELYHLNSERLAEKEKSRAFRKKDQALRQTVERMRQTMERELAEEKLHPAKRKVLQSLSEHWQGLTLFVEEPQVPMDNNGSERTLRIAAVGRKNYYGSGAEWSGKLATWMFSLLATLSKWKINARKWLRGYLQGCAEAFGKVPANVEQWLPWNLTAEQRKEMSEQEEEGRPEKG